MSAFTISAPALRALLVFWSDPDGARAERPPHEAVRKVLIPLGLMEYTGDGYRVTEKGNVYLHHLLKQPLPQEVPSVTWAYPET